MGVTKSLRGRISLREKLEFTVALCSRYTIQNESGELRGTPSPETHYSNHISYLSSDF